MSKCHIIGNHMSQLISTRRCLCDAILYPFLEYGKMASEKDDTIEELVYAIKEHDFALCKSILERDIDVNERHTVSFLR